MQTILSKTLADTMYYGTLPVLTYQIDYPAFSTTCRQAAALRINAFYVRNAKAAERYCRTELYAQAVSQARYTVPGPGPFRGYQWISRYQVTLNAGCISSLYTEQYSYSGGAHGSTARTSQTWDFQSGRRLHIRDFLKPHCTAGTCLPFSAERNHSLREILLADMEKQVAGRLIDSPGSYFDDYSSLLAEHFQEEQFYLTPTDLILYYQQYDIAPYASGIPEFSFPLA